jgi:hypothetical protein
LDPGRVRFCRERPDKAVIAAELGLTHFVDDRVDVLEHMVGVVTHRYLFGPQPRPPLDDIVLSPTWPIAARQILGTLAPAPTEGR